MNHYDTYKPSGIDWIGDVPSHWEGCRFKNFMELQNTASTSHAKIGLENIQSATGKYIPTDTEFDGNGVVFDVGDIVYGKLRPYLQKVWLAEFAGNAVGDFFVFRSNQNSIPAFVKYLLLSDGFTKQANGSTFGAKMPRVASDFILTLPFFLPPLPEQKAIAAYLDKRCGEIDKVITTQERRIELLREMKQSIITRAVTKGINPNAPMKGSGVEWIGEVPKHWEIAPLKRCANIQTGTTPSTKEGKYYADEDIAWFTPSDIEPFELEAAEKMISNVAKAEKACRIFPPKTIYFVGIGATIGKVSVCDFEASSNQQINAIMPNSKADYKYLALCLKSQKDEIYLTANTVTLPIINQERTGSLLIPIPSLAEQQSIVAYIEKKTKALDAAITKAQREVELLRELKQATITEVVTGKRKVC